MEIKRLLQDQVGLNLVSTVQISEGHYETMVFPGYPKHTRWSDPSFFARTDSEKRAIAQHNRAMRETYEGTRGARRENREIRSIYP